MMFRQEHGKKVPDPGGDLKFPFEINDPLMVVGGGSLAGTGYGLARARCGFVLGADGGADAIVARGAIPDAVVGDLDSLSAAARVAIPDARIHPIPEQDSTDFDKALRSVIAPLTLAVGFTGKRIDHSLAALDTLFARCDRAIILLSEAEVVLHTPKGITLDLPEGNIVSLFPLAPVRVRGKGLRWPEGGLDLTLAPGTRIGTSNEAMGGPVELSTDAAGLLTILPIGALDVAMAALKRADLHSPRG